MPAAERLGVAAAALLCVAIVVVDHYLGPQAQLLGLLAAMPFLAAAFAGMRETVAVGILALACGITGGLWGQDASTSSLLIRIVAIVIFTALAAASSRTRVTSSQRIAVLSRLADVAQAAVLRPMAARMGHVAFAVRYISASSEAHIGGDLYEALDTSYGIRVIIGDVRGKGLDAVRLASTVLGAFRHVAYERADLRNVVPDLDRAVARAVGEEDFVTAAIIEIRGGQLSVVNCGHPPPLLLRRGQVVVLDPPHNSPPLGFLPTPEIRREQLEPGDRLLLYTDGLAEARRDGVFFPIAKRMPALVGRGSVEHGLAALESALRDWVRGLLADDIALLVMEYDGSDNDSDSGPAWAATRS